MKDLTQIERGKTISFFNELDIETRTMLVTSEFNLFSQEKFFSLLSSGT
jgi:hypothetical protein